MYSTIVTGALLGVHAYPVRVEVDIAPGLPGFGMVGSLSGEVRESKERVQVSLKNAGLNIPPAHITVNLSPADRRKEGTAFDLPIAVGMLEALGYFPQGAAQGILFLGELGLNGEIRKARGVLPIVRDAAARGIKQCIVPKSNVKEGAAIPEILVRGASDIRQILEFLRAAPEKQNTILPAVKVDAEAIFANGNQVCPYDFSEVRGQETAKRTAEIAAAGFHNLLMTGPPGSGKSMIAKRIPGIMPPLTLEESLEVTSVMSVAGLLGEEETLAVARPFQNPHHTISMAAMTGGSSVPKPGMVSLSHRGVLFLDELPEFSRSVLDSLRQPLEDHQVHVARVSGTVTYPADFMLVCAMNPCPCGYYPDVNRCRCTEAQVQKYLGKVSGPIMDRIDLCVELYPVEIGSLCVSETNQKIPESSEEIRKRVMQAREKQEERYRSTRYRFNADVEASDMDTFCPLGRKEQDYMEQLYHSLRLSARAYHRILKVSRTIADLAGARTIGMEHLLEAVCYRPAQEYWK